MYLYLQYIRAHICILMNMYTFVHLYEYIHTMYRHVCLNVRAHEIIHEYTFFRGVRHEPEFGVYR